MCAANNPHVLCLAQGTGQGVCQHMPHIDSPGVSAVADGTPLNVQPSLGPPPRPSPAAAAGGAGRHPGTPGSSGVKGALAAAAALAERRRALQQQQPAASAGGSPAMTAAAAGGQQPAATERGVGVTHARDTSNSSLGASNSPAKALGPVIPEEGPWAAAARQLRAAPQAQQGVPSSPAGQNGVQPPHKAAGKAVAAAAAAAAAGVAVPGAVKPRGGARRGAVGPLLARLRQQDAP
jgi:hypothetical protein